MNFINLVFITDDNYTMPTCVAMTSAKCNKKSDSFYKVYVVFEYLLEENRERLEQLNAPGFEVHLVHVGNVDKYKNVVPQTQHVSKAALLKFDLPYILKDLDKVLYLDGDILVQDDLYNLYSTDVSKVYAGVVKDIIPMLRYKPSILKKLQSNHQYYFNSGVMLLNLDRMRKDDLSTKLLDYRINGINFFMDQDALNIVFQEQVIYFSIFDNFVYTLNSRCSREEIETYYGEKIYDDPVSCWQKARILHLTSPKKPWKVYMPYLSAAFRKYYDISPYKNEPLKLQYDVVENDNTDKIIEQKKKNVSKDKIELYRENEAVEKFLKQPTYGLWEGEERKIKIVVSLTTFPARINEVIKTLLPIMRQTMKPDHIILWLTNEEFPNHEEDLPQNLLALKKYGLEIKWGENLRAHTKYYYTMKMFPDDILITIDDDIHYDETLVETLYNSYMRHPKAISTLRAHLMTFDSEGSLCSYNDWKYQCSDYIDKPLMTLFATGVGGVLYPPHLLPEEVFNKYSIKNLTLKADDIWLKFMEVMNNIPVVLARANKKLVFVGESQQVGLCYGNVSLSGNDECIQNIIAYYNNYYGNEDTLLQRIYKDEAGKSAQYHKVSLEKGINSIGRDKKARKLSERIKDGIRKILRRIVPPPVAMFKREVRAIQRQQEQILTVCKSIYTIEERLKNQEKQIKKIINTQKQDSQRNLMISELLVSISERQKEWQRTVDEKLNECMNACRNINDKNADLCMDICKDMSAKNTDMLQEISGYTQEVLWAQNFHDAIIETEYLKYKEFYPGRGALGYPALYVLKRLLDIVHPIKILEIGMGQSTCMIMQYAQYYNAQHHVVESDSNWIDYYTKKYSVADTTKLIQLDYTFETYKKAENIRVYNGFENTFKDQRYDFILVDAPFAQDMNEYGRVDILKILPGCLNSKFVIMIDDTNRIGEKNTVSEIRRVLDNSQIKYMVKVYSGIKSSTLIFSEDLAILRSL